MLDPVAELAEHGLGDVERRLGDEPDPDPLRADQPDHLLDPVEQHLRRVGEEQVRLVEEDHDPGAIGVADLREGLIELAEEVEEQGRVEARGLHQPVGREDADRSATVGGDPHQVVEAERRLAEERVPALLLEGEKAALDRPDAGRRERAVSGPVLGRVLGDVGEDRAEVLEIQQKQPRVVRDREDGREDAALHLVQVEDPREEDRADLRDRGPDGMAGRAERVPEDHGHARVAEVGEPEAGDPLGDLRGLDTGQGEAREVALDVGEQDRDPRVRELLGEHPEGDGLARAGGAGHEAVPVQHPRQDADRTAADGDEEGFL